MPARTPEEVDALFEKALNAGDLEGLVALYEPDATLIPQPGQEAKGRDAIRQALAPMLAGKAQIDLKVERTVRSGEDLAATYGVWTMKAGDQEMSGKTIEVVRRQPVSARGCSSSTTHSPGAPRSCIQLHRHL